MPQILHVVWKESEARLPTELGQYIVHVRTCFFPTHKWILAVVIKAATTSALAPSPSEFMGENFNSYLGPYNKGTCPHFIDGETEVHGGLATGPRELEFEFRSVCSVASQMVLVVKNMPANAGDVRDVGSILIPGSGRAPGGGHGNPLQYSCLENPMDRGAWWASP